MTYFATKFSCPRDEVLYSLTMDTWGESSGSSEAPTMWFCALSVDSEDIDAARSAMETFDVIFDVGDEPADADLIGHWIVSTDDQGFVYVESFDTAEALAAEYQTRDDAYGEWLGEDEDLW